MPRCKTHYSRKAAQRVLDALMRLGGKGTTAQIAEITGGCATHSDVHSLRTWLREEHGYGHDDALAAVRAAQLGFNESGRNVYRYELRADVQELHRQIRAGQRTFAAEAAAAAKERAATAQGTGPLTPSGPCPPQRQDALFETRSAADERRRL